MSRRRAGSPTRFPRLDVRGPVAFGAAVVAIVLGGGLAWSALAPIEKGATLSGQIIVESKVQPVQHLKGGSVARVLVAEGADVKAGDMLIALDSSQLDEQIAALKSQARAGARQIELLRAETASLAPLLEKRLVPRSKVLALERQTAEIEKEAAAVAARITLAEQELARLAVRAPVAGRILSLAVKGAGGVVQPGQTIAEIVPENDRLVIEGRLPPAHIEAVKPGMAAKVWLTALSWREQRPLPARLAWVAPDSVEDKRTGQPYFVARIEIEGSRAEIARRLQLYPGMRAEILVVTGERTLLDQLLDPIVRNMSRSFRS